MFCFALLCFALFLFIYFFFALFYFILNVNIIYMFTCIIQKFEFLFAYLHLEFSLYL